MRRIGAAVLGGFLLVGATWAVGPASSARNGAPKAFLHSGDQRQRGESQWFTRGRHHGGGECSLLHGDGFAKWPPALQNVPEDRLRVGFRKNDRPDIVKMWDFRQVTPNGATVGEGKRVPLKVRPRRDDGEVVGWKVIFKRKDLGHHYLRMFVRWNGPHECDFVEAPYNFHSETLPADPEV